MSQFIYPETLLANDGEMGLQWAVFFDDFLEIEFAAADAGVWLDAGEVNGTVTVTGDTGTTGEVTITTTTVATDSGSFQKNGIPFQLTSGKQLIFETRFKLSVVDGTSDHDIVVGLCSTSTAPIETGVTDGVYFGKTADADIEIVCESSTTATTTNSGVDYVADTYSTYRFEFDGNQTVTYYRDGTSIGTVTTNIPQGVGLTPTFALANDGTIACTMTVDYVLVMVQR